MARIDILREDIEHYEKLLEIAEDKVRLCRDKADKQTSFASKKESEDQYMHAVKHLGEIEGRLAVFKEELERLENPKMGRPSIGTTKKVSLTLPDEIWEMIERRKKEWGASQSQTLRMMIEGYWNQEESEEERP